jgi:hypothetical protein
VSSAHGCSLEDAVDEAGEVALPELNPVDVAGEVALPELNPAQEAAAQLEVTRIVAVLGASVPVVAGVSLLAECEEVNGQPGVLFIDREEPS